MPIDIGDSMSLEAAEHRALEVGLWMFRPYETEGGKRRWWCTALQRDGRCSIYEERPYLCQDYRPGQDGLCVHYWPNPEGDAVDAPQLEGIPT